MARCEMFSSFQSAMGGNESSSGLGGLDSLGSLGSLGGLGGLGSLGGLGASDQVGMADFMEDPGQLDMYRIAIEKNPKVDDAPLVRRDAVQRAYEEYDRAIAQYLEYAKRKVDLYTGVDTTTSKEWEWHARVYDAGSGNVAMDPVGKVTGRFQLDQSYGSVKACQDACIESPNCIGMRNRVDGTKCFTLKKV